ncbi:MAG: FAD-binding oxidoreductase [Tannerellaceae bacterium]|nr:FAD-binding oxidoreductase [Tannerellaceae bacterium]
MDLYSGLPWWIAKNSLYNYYNPLQSDYKTDVVIIGSGITGVLVAHELCNSGIKCIVIDKRSPCTGSTIASTALLQYEIDTPLTDLADKIGETAAVKAYQACLHSIPAIEEVFQSIAYDPDLTRVPSIFYASDRKGYSLIKKEHDLRVKHNLPAEFIEKKELQKRYGMNAPGALVNHVSAQIDAYSAATHLLRYQMHRHQLPVFTHTEVTACKEYGSHCDVITVNGHAISCYAVIIAAGFEAGKFLPQDIMKLTSTYAIISTPMDEKELWPEDALIWETATPYLYIRTDSRNRIIVGGEDEEFRNPVKRDKLLRDKVETLEKKFKKLFPLIPFQTDMAWCGTFSSTTDGLPFIGSWPGNDKLLYALGYGGNGITFSMIAAEMLRNKLNGIKDDREDIFGFERMDVSLKE